MGSPSRLEPLRILHLEDNPYDTEIIHAMLADENIHCEMHRVDTRKDFESALKNGRWDLVISDFALPSFDALKALAMTRAKAEHIPFIIFSGTIAEEMATECRKKGVTNYVLKEHPAQLVSAIRAILNEAETREGRTSFET